MIFSAIVCHARIVSAPARCILATDNSIFIMSINVFIHWGLETTCGGFQRKANIFLAAVMPVRRTRVFQQVSFSEVLSFKSSTVGEQGIKTSSTFDKVVQILPQKSLTSLHSQYICIYEPVSPSEHRVQIGDVKRFMRKFLLGVR